MSGSGWFGKIKSGAKSLQETAKNRLEKVSESLDQKLKEARDDLDRQRQNDATAPVLPTVQRWRPSTDNPDGEIVAEAKPTPAEPPVVESTLSASAPPTDLPVIPETPVAAEEPITILRSWKHKRRSTKTSENKTIPVKTNDPNDEQALSVSEGITYSDSNTINAKEVNTDELVQSVSLSITEEQESSITSTTNTKEDIAQANSTADVSNSSLDKSDNETRPEIIPTDQAADKTSQSYPDTETLPATTADDNIVPDKNIIHTNTDASDASIIASNPEDVIDNVPTDEFSSSVQSDEKPVEQSSTADDTVNQQLDPVEMSDEKTSVLTYNEDLPTEDSNTENISNETPADEILVEQSITENTKKDISEDEPITSATVDDATAENDDLPEIPSSSMTNADLPIIDVKTESISTDESPALSQNNEPSVEEFNPQYQEPDFVDNEPLIPTNTNQRPDSFETALSSNDINLTTEESKIENTPIDIPTNELSTSTYNDDIPDYEPPLVKNTEEPSVEQSDLTKMSEEKLSTSNETEDLSVADSNSDDTSTNAETNEWPTSAATEQMSVDRLDLPNTTPEIPDYELSTVKNTEEVPIVDVNIDSSSVDEPDDDSSVSIHDDDIPVEQYNSEQQETNIAADDFPSPTHVKESSVKQSDTAEMPDATNPSPVDKLDDDSSVSTHGDDTSVEQYHLEDQETENLEDEQPIHTSTMRPSEDLHVEEEVLQEISNNELVVPKENEKAIVEQAAPENVQTKIFDDVLPAMSDIINTTAYTFNEEDIFEDEIDDAATKTSRIDENISPDTPIDIPKTYAQMDSISLDISDDEASTTTDVVDSPNINSDLKNILMNIPDEDLPTLADMEPEPNDRPEPENILMHIPDDQLPSVEDIVHSSNRAYEVENILMDIPDDELPTIEDSIPLPTFNPTANSILMSIPDDDLPTIDSTEENFQMILTDAKLPALSQTEEISSNYSLSEDTTDVDNPSKSPSTNSTPIEHLETKDESATSSNDLEDSFEELKAPDIAVQKIPPPPPEANPQLTSLREMISKLEDDDDDDDEDVFLTSVRTKTIVPEEKKIQPENKLSTTFKAQLLSSSSDSDDNPDDLFANSFIPTPSSSDLSTTNNPIGMLSTISLETKWIPKKQVSTVNTHFIPAGTKLLQMTCSSSYIYLCTTERKIYYAKFNTNNCNELYKWQLHTDLAEQLFVSDSNRTVWRFHNKLLYTGNDPMKYPPLGSLWTKIKLDNDQSYPSISINDQCGWLIKNDGTLWLLRIDERDSKLKNVPCPFNLDKVSCFSDKIGVSTNDGQILIRTGCTHDEPDGSGWIFIDPNLGPLADFLILTNHDTLIVVDEKHHLSMHQWTNEKGFYQILSDDDLYNSNERPLISVNSHVLCLTNGKNQIHAISDCLTGVQLKVVEKNTSLQRLIGAFYNEDCVWGLTADRRIGSSNGKIFAKPRQAQNITHATFVPNNSSTKAVLWSLDQSCGIYVRPDLADNTDWEQVNQVQFESRRRLINIVCSNKGVWAVDDQGHIYFRHGHISASQHVRAYGATFLPPAWIQVPGEAQRRRSFTQVYCGPADWMIYATDNKQTVYTRTDINEENPIGTSWKAIEDCSALELALSEHTLWLLTSVGEIQCRENISLSNPIGTRSTTLSGRFLSLTASMDDSQVWAIDSQRNLLKLDRLIVAFEK